MQKRARPVESQKLRRTVKGRAKINDPIKESVAISMEYFRLFFLWVGIITVDVIIGFRIELLWPFWLISRTCYESFSKNHNAVVTLANQNVVAIFCVTICAEFQSILQQYICVNRPPLIKHMIASWKFSLLFVCITATSDLLCFLFIPVPWIIFLSSSYVWVSLIWTTYGGFIRGSTGERSQLPILLLGFFLLTFEYFGRRRCDLIYLSGANPFSSYIGITKSCEQIQGLEPSIARNLNAFFGAHCIGYPLVLISFSLRYYFREWLIRRQQVEISRKNEIYQQILTEALPAKYNGPQDYSLKLPPLDDETESLDFHCGPPMILAPPLSANGSHANGNAKRSTTKHTNGLRNRGNARSKHLNNSLNSSPQQRVDHRREDDDDSEGCDEWRERPPSNRLSWIRIVKALLVWIFGSFSGSSSDIDVDEEDDDSQLGENNKKTTRNGDLSKNRQQVSMNRKGRGRDKTSKDKINGHANVEKSSNGHILSNGTGGEHRDSSRDTSISQHTQNPASAVVEIDRLKTEVMHLKAAEQDARLQLTVSRNLEATCRQEISQLRSALERMEHKFISIESLREVDRQSLCQLEKKYADLLNRKNEIERELMQERNARKEDGGKISDTTELHRERERQLEKDIDRLREENAEREDRITVLERETSELRNYKEQNNSDLTEKDDEIRMMRERVGAMEEALHSENKLKQDLFRALGDARTQNAHLEEKLRSLDLPLSLNVHHMSSNNDNTCHSQPMSPTCVENHPPPYSMAAHQTKLEHYMANHLYAAFQQHHSSPTGEHVLFDQPPPPTNISCSIEPLLNDRMGKFGAPANPTRTN